MSPVHIEKPGADYDAPLTVVVMECGASCVLLENGGSEPADIDFVSPEWPDNATCEDCKRAWNERMASLSKSRRKAPEVTP